MKNWVVGDALPNAVDAIQFDMKLGSRILGTGVDIPLNLDVPGFNLNVNGGFSLDIGWSLDFGFGLSLKDNFYLATNKDQTQAELKLDVKAFLDGSPNDPNTVTQFTADGKLLFLKANVVDNNPKGRASGLYGQLGLDLKGDSRGRLTFDKLMSGRVNDIFGLKFDLDGELNLGMELSLDGAKGMPRLGADLVVDWDWSWRW